ncbi:MAG: peptidase [Bryobacterales bacterium]|nr:peptidase [Bryobacterales bacterium]
MHSYLSAAPKTGEQHTLDIVVPSVPKPEIKSPAGHWPQLHAAVEAGADAVYFGLTHFTARAKSGFTMAELPEALRTLHRRGVKGYITFNTLIFDDELQDAARALAAIAEAGADAILVQDWAAVALARRIAPDLEIHGSTQMSITSVEGVKHAQGLGVRRMILARELSLDEIRAIRGQTDAELELFVHGALCVSYSGQCFSSEAWGGRSANRGQCAQACRLPYEMIVDGRPQPLGDARYLLSPGDLYALEQVPEIVRIGISAIKIEGRYKDAAYVALTTRAYRKAVDDAWAGREQPVDRGVKAELEQAYSRGLGPFFLTGTNHQAVVRGRAPRHRGLRVGRVTRVSPAGVVVSPESDPAIPRLKPGDGVVFDAADWRSPGEPEEGGRIYQVLAGASGDLELAFANGALNSARIRPGDLVWRTHDPEIDKAARPYTTAVTPVSKQKVDVSAVAREGQPFEIEWSLSSRPEARVHVFSDAPLAAAQNRGLTREFLREQLGRLGNTPYELDQVKLESDGSVFAPSSLLNQLRRQAVEKLVEIQSRLPAMDIHDPLNAVAQLLPAPKPAGLGTVRLHLLVRTAEQLDAALATAPALAPASITLDYLDLYGLLPSLERVKAAGIEARVASPRILKPGEQRIADFLLRCDSPILVRSAGLLETLRSASVRLDGDFSLNAANAISADMLLAMGLGRVAPTHDLNAAQVAALAQGVDAERLEAIAYHHLPVFHTEHCVFCRFLSSGTSYRDCGRPCERHQVALRDSGGRPHPVMADVGCRNTVFGAEAQEASMHLAEWLAAGIRHFRLEFVHETPDQVTRIGRAFADFFGGRSTPEELHRALKRSAPEGVTEGSLFVPSSALLPVLQ